MSEWAPGGADPVETDVLGAAALPGYAPMGAAVRPDPERWPTLTTTGAARLAGLRTHPHAPRWQHACGDLLTADDHERLDRDRADLAAGGVLRGQHEVPDGTPEGDGPGWVPAHVERVRRTTSYGAALPPVPVDRLPTTCRADLVRDLAAFVARDHPLDRLVQGTSSGATGAALVVPLDPLEISRELVLLEQLLAEVGVDWTPPEPEGAGGTDRVGLLSVVDQAQAFTYASVMTARGEQRMARVNLDPRAWRRVGDREAFLRDARPQVVTGSALSLLALARLPLDGVEPLALVSGAVELTPAARAELTARWGAPVLDLYGLKETGPLAVSVDGGPHVAVRRRVHLEVLDGVGRSVPDGGRGEVTVTVDGNPHLPLVRYRTGDTATAVRVDGRLALADLEGRAPIVLRAADGRDVPSVDLTQQLQHHGAHAWSVVQRADGRVEARVLGGDPRALRDALVALLGDVVEVTAVTSADALGPGKPRRFAREGAPT